MKIEVRAIGRRETRRRRGLSQRRVAGDLGSRQDYILASDADAGQAYPKLQQQMPQYFGCRFEYLFEVVLIDPDTKREQILRVTT